MSSDAKVSVSAGRQTSRGLTEPRSDASRREESSSTEIGPGPQPLSLRRNFVWIFLGNAGHAACQIGLLLALAALGNAKMAGQFALGIAVTAPIFMLSNMGLRTVQATDARQEYHFREYLAVRLLSSFAAVCIVICIAWFVSQRLETMLVLLLVCAAKTVESISDIHHGLFQQRERLDWIAKSKFSQGALALSLLGMGVYFTGSILIGVGGFLTSYVIVLLAYDLPKGLHVGRTAEAAGAAPSAQVWLRPKWKPKRLWGLASLGLPMGGTALFASLNKHIPRYFIAYSLSEHELGVFSVLVSLMMAGTTVTRALNASVCPRLARFYRAGQKRNFSRLFVRLLAFYVLGGILGVVLVDVAGQPLLAMFFRNEFAEHANVLVYVMLAAGITYVVALTDIALIATRRIWPLLPKVCLATVTSAAACFWLVPTLGLQGAAIALVAGRIPVMLLGLVMLWFVMRRMPVVGKSGEPIVSAPHFDKPERRLACVERKA